MVRSKGALSGQIARILSGLSFFLAFQKKHFIFVIIKPTRRLPCKERTMKTIVKITPETEHLSSLLDIPVQELSDRIIKSLLQSGAILSPSEPDDWGVMVDFHCHCSDVPVETVGLLVAGREMNKSELYLLKLQTTIGSGDCPNCGGTLEEWDVVYGRGGYGDGYNSPLEPNVLSATYICTHCKQKIHL